MPSWDGEMENGGMYGEEREKREKRERREEKKGREDERKI